MKLYGQSKRIYDLIRESGTSGITSQQLRNFTHIVDVPKVISTLNDKGYGIISTPEKLGDSRIKRYFLKEQPVKPVRVIWDNEKKIAIQIYS